MFSFHETQAYEIKHLGTEHGLSSGFVNDFEIDSLGYMWMATNNGLNRYSGYEIRKYSLDAITTGGNQIIDLIRHNGDLLAVSRGGIIYKYRYSFDDFILLNEGFDKDFISSCLIQNKYIAIGLTNGLLMYDIAKNIFSEIFYSDIRYNRHLVVRNNKLYAASSNGLQIFRIENGKLIIENTILENRDIIHFDFDRAGRIWIGTEKNGLCIVEKDAVMSVELFDETIKTYTVRSIAFNKQAEAIVAVDRLGLFVIDENLNVLKQFLHNPDDENSIRQNSIHDIFIDDTNVYWLANGETGVDILYNEDRPFRNISHIINEPNSLHNNSVRSICEDEDGNVWFGTEDGLSRMSPDGNWKKFNQSNDLKGTPVLSISKNKNQLLLGTYGEGVLNFNPTTGKTWKFPDNNGSNLSLVFTSLKTENEFWVGGNDGPVTCYVDGRIQQTYSVASLTKCFAAGNGDTMFVGAINGVYELNKRNGSNRKIVFENQSSGNLLTNVYAFYYNQDKLWIGNDKGLFVYDLIKNSAKKYNPVVEKGLGTVYSIQSDTDKNLWLGTGTGLWKFNVEKEFFRNYDERDGVIPNEFGFGASTKFADGRVAFGGPMGTLIFHPDSVQEYEASGNIKIAEFLINGVNANTILDNSNVNYFDEIVLDYNQNSLSFTFELIELHGPRKTNFEWQLIGYDEQALNSLYNRTANYSKLSPGNYTLLVKTISPNGNYFGTNYQLQITIRNPLWLRWWAIVVYLVLLSILLYLIYTTKRSREQQRFSDEKIKFFVNVAHDIRTPVSLIQLLIEQLTRTNKNSDSIELIKRNAGNLNEYVSQLLEFQKAERKKMKLSVRKVKLKKLLHTIAADFQPLLEKKSIDISIASPDIELWMDKPKMSRVFSNLISNAIKYGEEGGYIKIQAELKGGSVRLDFIDNGLGIPLKHQKMIFTRFSRAENTRESGISGSGIGLMLAKHIVELHKGQILIESKEHIGSTFSVILKLGSEHFGADELIVEDQIDEYGNKVLDVIGENKLVLLVEDNEDLRTTLRQELDNYYRVIEAPNGKEGLVLALEKSPDIIITDVMMPQMSGKELCRVVKSNFKTSHIPVVMITALGGVEEKVEGLEVGADAYVEKPFSIEVLKATINNLLRTRQALGNSSATNKKNNVGTSSPDEAFLSNAVQFIKDNRTNEHFSIDVLCEKLGMSRSNLFRKLKGLTGMTPSDLIIKIKLNHAVELFKSGQNMRIADIAYESGFNDPKYFSTVFKKFYGTTPKEFMENQN